MKDTTVNNRETGASHIDKRDIERRERERERHQTDRKTEGVYRRVKKDMQLKTCSY